MVIKGSYPNHFKSIDQLTFKLTTEMWYSAFKDQDYQTVLKVTQKYILENRFPPTIADLRQEVIQITNPDSLVSPENAWEVVISAVKRFGYYQQPEAFKTFSDPIKRAVKAIGWENICRSENIGIERSNFYKMYSAIDKPNREQAIIPKEIYSKLQELTHQKVMGQDKNEVSKM